MPPTEDSAAADGAVEAQATTLEALPLLLAQRIFALLPADARLLAAAVCRSWRALLAERSLWTRLDLSKASGVANPTSNALLRAAAARASGQLEVLRVSLRFCQPHDTVLAVLAANAGALRELTLCTDDTDRPPSSDTVAELLRAAPGLRLMETGVFCRGAEALPVLRKEPPFGLLRLKRATFLRGIEDISLRDVADGLAAHTSLEVVQLYSNLPVAQAESGALVDALLSLLQLRTLRLGRVPVPVLARLLGSPTLKSLGVYGAGVPLLDSPASTALLCDVLRANTQLETLVLDQVDLLREMGAATALMTTLQAHPSLRNFTLSPHIYGVAPEHAAAAGAALGALVAHAPALESLNISGCNLGDAGLGPVMDALPRARHLQKLSCYVDGMSKAFARDRLLPAVRACGSLRTLIMEDSPAVREAQALLQQRS